MEYIRRVYNCFGLCQNSIIESKHQWQCQETAEQLHLTVLDCTKLSNKVATECIYFPFVCQKVIYKQRNAQNVMLHRDMTYVGVSQTTNNPSLILMWIKCYKTPITKVQVYWHITMFHAAETEVMCRFLFKHVLI